jgi:hypothetical protein
MSEIYTPEVSGYKIGQIVNVEHIGKLRKELTIQLIKDSGPPKPTESWGFRRKQLYQETKGKFEIPNDEEEEEKDTLMITLDFDALIDPVIIPNE